jgi:putative inorganic carbon (hco3(-)) transporter
VVVVGAAVIVPRLPERFWALGSGFLRVEIWGSALEMLRDRPLTGVGIDQFYNQFRLTDEAGAFRYMPPGFEESFTSHPHNIVLDWWLSLGIMGVPLLLWLGWRFYRVALERIRGATSAGDREGGALAAGLLAAMVAFAVHGLVDNSYFLLDLALTFWLGCGMLQVLRTTDERGLVGEESRPPAKEI